MSSSSSRARAAASSASAIASKSTRGRACEKNNQPNSSPTPPVSTTAMPSSQNSVDHIEPVVSDALPREVVECLVGVLKEARFEPLPKAGKMQVPVTFTRTR